MRTREPGPDNMVACQAKLDLLTPSGQEDIHTLQVFQIRPKYREMIPAVAHVDGTGRLQTVHKETNPRFHRLIDQFREVTGIPLVLNTSFNENEPIVLTPAQALDCFLRTHMDVLVMGRHVVQRQTSR